MDQSLPSGSSGVTVEYTDPSGIFAQIQPLLAERLPLRNLHWKSPNRPLRSIDSLQVTFVPGAEKRLTSDNSSFSTPQRRHQIPGLRQTPYLKIYLLRCDDNEAYKATSRRAIREWIKEHSPSTQSNTSANNQENHDAFEWLIVHAVYPDTPAASQSRSSSTASAAKASSEKVGNTKWPGRGSSTVLEKIKADFNGSSKSAPDRVAQIRLAESSSPPQSQARPAGVEIREQDEAWTDLTNKLETLILSSFDMRVSQYEEDIREKDSQRNLPGWNFCTFFILKEGLARGFENVGLFEDALIGYDELALGLDVIVRDLDENTPGGTFLGFSESLQKQLQSALEGEQETTGDQGQHSVNLDLHRAEYPLNSERKPYRDLILANNISIFDVRVYIFTRQLSLLLKAANASSLHRNDVELRGKNLTSIKRDPDAEDLLTLAETCRRATEFLGIGTRSLREDLTIGLQEKKPEGDISQQKSNQVIDNMVASWTFGVALQILDQTRTDGLSIPASTMGTTNQYAMKHGQDDGVQNIAFDSGVPSRKQSLPDARAPSPRPSSQEMFSPEVEMPSAGFQRPDSSGSAIPIISRTGTEELASWRAEIYLMARNTLRSFARKRDWRIDCTKLETLYTEVPEFDDLHDVPLDDDDSASDEEAASTSSTEILSLINGLSLRPLRASVQSEVNLRIAYEELTDLALRHFLAANRTKSAERVFADMAILKFRVGDYASAASYFHQVAPFYGGAQWGLLEGTMLELYARCLKKLDRKEDYVQLLLKMLPKYILETSRTTGQAHAAKVTAVPKGHGRRISQLPTNYVDDLLIYTQGLQKDISAPLEDFFGGLEFEPRVFHGEGRDGLQVHFKLRSLLGINVQAQSIRVKLIEDVVVHPRVIWFESDDNLVIRPSPSSVVVGTDVTVRGKYTIDEIEVRSNNILFRLGHVTQRLLAREFRESRGADTTSLAKPLTIFCYPASNGLQVKVQPPSYIHLAQSRSFDIEVKSGHNNIISGEISIRSGTAGLRIKLAETTVMEGKVEIQSNSQGTVEFLRLEAACKARFNIPYNVETDPTSLSVKLEISYSTEDGDFTLLTSTTIPSILPVSVNVQDMFREGALFSRFTIVPATLVPLRVLSCRIESYGAFKVTPAMAETMTMDVFPRQPASVLYKFVQRPSEMPREESILALEMSFRCLDDEVLGNIEEKFEAAAREAGFGEYSRLLLPFILGSIRTSMTANDLETIGLIRAVELPSYHDIPWDHALIGFRLGIQKSVKQWLKEWHVANTVIPLPDESPFSSTLTRKIIIPVEVPQVRFVHTADLHILHAETDDRQIIVAVGQPIAAELRIKHTQRWSGPKKGHEGRDGDPSHSGRNEEKEERECDLEFSYEVHANPEVWLIGGKRRGNFRARENETSIFPILLLPQRAGHLMLPGLDVKAFEVQTAETTPGGKQDTTMPTTRKQIPSEVDFKNHGESVLVLPDLKSTTISLDPGGPGGGSWLVESERRAQMTES